MTLMPARSGHQVLVVLVVAALAILASGCSRGSTNADAPAEKPSLAVCSDIPYEPFEFGAPDDPEGFDVDLLDAVAERLDRSVTFVATPLDQFAQALAVGRCEVVASALPITDAATSPLVFSEPYLEVDQSLLVHRADEESLSTTEALTGRTVGVVTGSVGADLAASELGPNATIIDFPTHADALAALESGAVDAVLADGPLNDHAALEDASLTVTVRRPTDVRYGLATAPDGDLLVQVDAALAELRADGTLDELTRRWFGG